MASIKSRLAVRKLRYLKRVVNADSTEVVSARVMRSLTDDVDSLCLVRECRELEEAFGTRFTEVLLQEEGDNGMMFQRRRLKRWTRG